MAYNPYGQSNVPLNAMPTGFQPQQTGFQASSYFQQPQQQQSNVDQLSFLSPQDQQKFQNLFNASTNSLSISPESARSILLKSNLSPHQLARIWELCDINKTGDLLFPEFALALHLCNVALRGQELPYQLDPQIKEEVTKYVDKINFSIPEGQSSRSNSVVNNPGLQPSASDIFESNPVGNSTTGIPQMNHLQPTGFNYQQPALFTSPQKPQGPFETEGLTSQATGFGFQNSSNNTNNNSFATNQQNQTLPTQQTGYNSQGQNQFLSNQQTGFNSQPQNSSLNSQSSNTNPFPSQQNGLNQFPSLQPQQTGFNQFNTSSSIPQQQQQTGFNANPTPLAQQPTGLVPLKSQTTGAPLQRQQTGLPPKDQTTGLTHQTTGFQSSIQPLNPQATGLVPLNTQQTGQLNPQATGLVPIQIQATGSLQQNPTGLVPLNNQKTGSSSPPKPLNPQQTGNLVPLRNQQTGQPVTVQQTGNAAPLTQQPTGLIPLKTGGGGLVPLQQQKTGYGQNSFFLTNLVEQSNQQSATFNYLSTQQITSQEKQLFNKIFDNYDTKRKGQLTADLCAEIFRKSGLNREDLEKIWDLVTRPNQTHLDKETFQLGMWLIYKRLNGFDVPTELPDNLKPSSIKILDDVKNRLKIQGNVKSMKKSSNSKIDGSRFKNNDDELVTSSSRHRRRNGDFNGSSTKKEVSKKNDGLSIEELKKQIKEKRILLDALQYQIEENANNDKNYEREDLQKIEELKSQIKNLPSSTGGFNSDLDSLKSKFNNLISKVPILINEISEYESSITNLKLQLYKLKNPSTVIGSGPNGEITEADKIKAKSKLLLAQKMAKLTGKPIDPGLEASNNDEAKLNEEILKIQESNKTNQQMIKDIESSIKEVSFNISNGFKLPNNEEEYKKWELGIGLQPEVQNLIKGFKIDEVTNKYTNLTLNSSVPAPIKTSDSDSYSYSHAQPAQSPVVSSPANGSPTFQTPDERRAYIREQAKKRLEERKAKFGLRGSSRPSSPAVQSPPVHPSQPVIQAPAPAPAPAPVQPVQQEPEVVQEESSSDDDDEEEFQRMEEIRRLKRMERDARMASELVERTYHGSNPFARK